MQEREKYNYDSGSINIGSDLLFSFSIFVASNSYFDCEWATNSCAPRHK